MTELPDQPRPDDQEQPVTSPSAPEGADPPAEAIVIGLLLAAGVCAGAFIAIYALDRLPYHTQLLGSALGLSFVLLAAAAIVFGIRLVDDEEGEEDYPSEGDPEAQEAVAEIVESAGSRLTRGRLLGAAAGGAGTVLGVALITPAVSLGPVFDMEPMSETAWSRGRRLVDEAGRPLLAADIDEDVFYTAFPEGADRNELGSPLVLVRLDPSQLDLPAGREDWAPEGILAYSKICTHAGCAIALYRTPLFPPVSPKPALVCPCHYSTFDPATGASVIFGPAGRPLPQLPLEIDTAGGLRAAGNLSGPPGPSWWGVRMRQAT